MFRKLSKRAMEKLLTNERAANAMVDVLAKVQRGKKELDKRQTEVLEALNFASQAQFKALSKRLAGLKRRVRDLDEKLDQAAGGDAE